MVSLGLGLQDQFVGRFMKSGMFDAITVMSPQDRPGIMADRDKMQLLLDAGADVNARSDDRRTAVVIASGIVGAAPALSLLLDYGADPFVSRPTDPSPLREAARVGDAEMFRLLLEYGVSSKGGDGAPAMVLRTNCPTG